MNLIRTKCTRKIVYFNIFIFLFISSCGEWSNYSLGNNLSIWEGDKKEDRAIIYCEGNCHGGIYVIPTYKRHYDSSGNYAEYVKEVLSNKGWVIVKTILLKEKKENYWIISKDFNIENLDCAKANCDSILQSNVFGPFNYHGFREKNKELRTNLKFE